MLIFATVGHTTLAEDQIRKIVLAGADVIRYNFAYRNISENVELVNIAKKTINDLNSSAKILIDFPLNKIRLGDFDIKIFAVKENQELILKSAPFSPNCHEFIPVDTQALGQKVYVDQTITIGDGEISMQVTEILNSETIKVKILNNGVINYIKTFNCKYRISEAETIKLYDETLEKIKDVAPNIIAISFINFETNKKIKELILSKNINLKVIIKIENGLEENDIEKICLDNFYSSILIDRGELGVNEPFEKMSYYQELIIRAAKRYGKKVIISTQILESTIYNFIPSRSDINDLAEIVRSGVNGIMFCMETSSSSRPAYPISVAKKIILEIESHKNI